MSTMAPTCDLVREAVSARLDDEETRLSQGEIDWHLVGCSGCRQFAAGTVELRRQAAQLLHPPVQPPATLLATVAATRRRPPPLWATRTLLTRLRGVVVSGRVPLALAAMAVGVAMPIASNGALGSLYSGHGQSRATCSSLLVEHHHLLEHHHQP